MHAQGTIRRIGALALAVLLAGCGVAGSASSPGSAASPVTTSPVADPSPTEAPTQASAATPTPTASAAPIGYGAATVVEGVATFVSGDIGTQTVDPDGSMHSRDGQFTLQEDMNDARVSGRHTVTGMAMDYWGAPGGDNGALVQWGDERIENDGGAWVGWASGIYSTDRGDIIVAWFSGTGGYAGLSYFYMTDSRDFEDGFTSVYRVRGQIFPGDPPAQP